MGQCLPNEPLAWPNGSQRFAQSIRLFVALGFLTISYTGSVREHPQIIFHHRLPLDSGPRGDRSLLHQSPIALAAKMDES
jgi:hypothetical protein